MYQITITYIETVTSTRQLSSFIFVEREIYQINLVLYMSSILLFASCFDASRFETCSALGTSRTFMMSASRTFMMSASKLHTTSMDFMNKNWTLFFQKILLELYFSYLETLSSLLW